jgi:RNA polymerase sigma factor for flagellar operon FliA
MRERGVETESGAGKIEVEKARESGPWRGPENRTLASATAMSVPARSEPVRESRELVDDERRYSVTAVAPEALAPADPSRKPHQDQASSPEDGVATDSGLAVSPDPARRRPGTAGEEQERMMVEHLPIVRFLARRIHERLPQHVDMEDLVSAGVLGLMDAFTKFDPEKKVQFRSYAQFRIRGAILDSLRTLDWSPRDLRRKGRAVEEAIRLLTARFGRAATESEVAMELNMSLAAYQQLLGELKGLDIGTLHMERSEDSGEEELAYIPNKPDEDPLFRCLRGEMRQRLADAIAELPERERLVMTLYYYEEMTMKEIGLTLGVVESRVSQIHASAVLHLRVLLADLTTVKPVKERPGKEKPAVRAGEERRSAPARGSRAM